MNIWLDDIRLAPERWVHFKKNLFIEKMSFDYNLSHPKEVRLHSNDPRGLLLMKIFSAKFESTELPKYEVNSN